MQKNIGDALKKAVEVSPPQVSQTARPSRVDSVLMNFNRRRIFQQLCLRPCMVLNDIARTLDVSRATASWHIKILVNNDYVEAYNIYGKDRYAPRGMLKRGEPAILLSLLNDARCAPIYTIVKDMPGRDSKALGEMIENRYPVGPCLRKLEKGGLVSSVKDGRHVRYFPTDKIGGIARYERARMKGFQSTLVKRLEAEHLNPQIMDIKGGNLVIKLRALGNDENLIIPHNIVETALAATS